MSFSSSTKSYINQFLRRVNLRLGTLTLEKAETERLKALERLGHFRRPVFPLPSAFESRAFVSILEELALYQSRFDDFNDASHNDVGYTYNNTYFTSPDAEVLYTLIRSFQPRTVVEVGCGNSTKIIRQAIIDGQLNTHLTCIDPHPRGEIASLADQLYLKPVQALESTELFRSLKEGDIFFIDSSHEIKTGNDVVFLYLNVIPELPPGVLIHIHDIFLPYDYPSDWVLDEDWEWRAWNEQYLVYSLLMLNNLFEILWAGHFLQRTQIDFSKHFPHLKNRVASSLWLRKRK